MTQDPNVEKQGKANGNDVELFQQFLAGDDDAFLQLFDRHAYRIGSYCRKMVGYGEGANDVIQDFWERVIRQREKIHEAPPNPLGLFYWMARNLCLNHIRDRKEHDRLDLLTEGNHPPSEDQSRSQLEELVLIALDRLPLSQREVIILHTYSGYSFEEIAEMMDETAGGVRMKAWRARRKLKRIIAALVELDSYDEDE